MGVIGRYGSEIFQGDTVRVASVERLVKKVGHEICSLFQIPAIAVVATLTAAAALGILSGLFVASALRGGVNVTTAVRTHHATRLRRRRNRRHNRIVRVRTRALRSYTS